MYKERTMRVQKTACIYMQMQMKTVDVKVDKGDLRESLCSWSTGFKKNRIGINWSVTVINASRISYTKSDGWT